MATITERQPGVFFARVWLPPTSDGQKGRQIGKVFRGGEKDVRQQVAAWEAELRGTAPSSVGATVADLLRLWQEAKQFDWQPTSARDYASRCRAITEAIGTVRLVDLDPFRVDVWVGEMRKAGVGEGRSARVSPRCARRSVGDQPAHAAVEPGERGEAQGPRQPADQAT